MIGGPCLVALASFGRARRSFGFALPSPPFRRAADLLEGPGARGGGRLELGLGAAHSGDLAGVGERGAAAAAAAAGGEVGCSCGFGWRRPGWGLAADLHDRRGRSVGAAACRRRPEAPAERASGLRPAALARGRPCCPCRRRRSAPGVSLPVSGLPFPLPLPLPLFPVGAGSGSGVGAGVVLVGGSTGSSGPADPTCLRRRPCPRRCRCHSRSVAVAVRPGVTTCCADWLSPPCQRLVLLGLGACDRPRRCPRGARQRSCRRRQGPPGRGLRTPAPRTEAGGRGPRVLLRQGQASA